jgi:predicted PhzF superfamily epimerase YddE/YHI9
MRTAAPASLRWFTPVYEVDLCGHATLASAHLLWERGLVARDQRIRFSTRSGELAARRRARHDGDWIELDFPVEIARAAPPPVELLEALRLPDGCRTGFVGCNRMDWLVELGRDDGDGDDLDGSKPDAEPDAVVRSLQPDLARLARIRTRGVIVTARSGVATRADPRTAGRAVDFVSRFFAPAAGVPEDPVTGSAHCALAPHWAARLGRPALTGFQASRRGGCVGVELAGERVMLRGRAVTIVHGEIEAFSAGG